MWCGVLAAVVAVLIWALVVMLVRERMKSANAEGSMASAWNLAEHRLIDYQAAMRILSDRDERIKKLSAQVREKEETIADLDRGIEQHRGKLVAAEGSVWHWKQRAERAETALRIAAGNLNSDISRLSEALKTEKAPA